MSSNRHKDNVNSQLLALLECPICLETSTPPIHHCVNGHSVCNSCRSAMHECGVCRAPGQPASRCLGLEGIAALVKVPCWNAVYGCKRTMGLSELAAHFPLCKFPGKAYCFLCVEWRGANIKTFLNHLSQEHKAVFPQVNSSGSYLIPTNIFGSQKDGDTNVVIKLGLVYFWHRLSYFSEKEAACTVMGVNSPSDDAILGYHYELEFSSKHGKSKVTYVKDIVGLKKIDGCELSNLISVPSEIIDSYAGEEFTYSLTIAKS